MNSGNQPRAGRGASAALGPSAAVTTVEPTDAPPSAIAHAPRRLTFTARSSGRGSDHCGGRLLQRVIERIEAFDVVMASQRGEDQVIGEHRVAGQDRPMEVGAEDVVGDGAL